MALPSTLTDTFDTALTLSSAIEAGVSTIFVGLGEDPQVLAIRAPQLFGVSLSNLMCCASGPDDSCSLSHRHTHKLCMEWLEYKFR